MDDRQDARQHDTAEDPGAAGAGADAAGEEQREARQADARRAEEELRDFGRAAWSSLSDVGETVSDLFDSVRGMSSGARFPRYDLIHVPGEGYRLAFDLPGLSREDIDVGTVGDELTVSGSRARPGLPPDAEVLRTERPFGRFRRSVRLPAGVDTGGIRARYEDGVLLVSLPDAAGAEPNRVEVE